MKTKKLLVIEKLVVAIDDDYPTADPNKITIDEALRYLLEKRGTAKAVLHNTAGNFVYFNASVPVGISPDVPETFTKEILLGVLDQNPDLDYAGVMMTLLWDEDLKGYRNIYNASEEAEFQKKKEEYLAFLKETAENETSTGEVIKGTAVGMESDEPATTAGSNEVIHCSECTYNICDESCPNDPPDDEEG